MENGQLIVLIFQLFILMMTIAVPVWIIIKICGTLMNAIEKIFTRKPKKRR